MIIRPYVCLHHDHDAEDAPPRRRIFYGWVIVAAMFAINFSTMCKDAA